MYVAKESLGFWGIGFSPMFALLKLTFLLPLRPTLLMQILLSEVERSPTNVFFITSHSFGRSLSPGHLRCKSARAVSYYALFQGSLLLGKPLGCLCTPTSFITQRSFRGLIWWFGLFPSRWWSLSPIVSLADPCLSLVFIVFLHLVPLMQPAPK